LPFGLLYSIFREELLILKKTFKDLLNKGYICISNLKAGALILFIYKLGGGLYFYYNYRTLNAIIRIDCYFLLLIHKTFKVLKGAR
ncbi:hypothetical protein NEUTE1DRAFT_53012, partial [Neurospora tetrasperma FGSC 2508]